MLFVWACEWASQSASQRARDWVYSRVWCWRASVTWICMCMWHLSVWCLVRLANQGKLICGCWCCSWLNVSDSHSVGSVTIFYFFFGSWLLSRSHMCYSCVSREVHFFPVTLCLAACAMCALLVSPCRQSTFCSIQSFVLSCSVCCCLIRAERVEIRFYASIVFEWQYILTISTYSAHSWV